MTPLMRPGQAQRIRPGPPPHNGRDPLPWHQSSPVRLSGHSPSQAAPCGHSIHSSLVIMRLLSPASRQPGPSISAVNYGSLHLSPHFTSVLTMCACESAPHTSSYTFPLRLNAGPHTLSPESLTSSAIFERSFTTLQATSNMQDTSCKRDRFVEIT